MCFCGLYWNMSCASYTWFFLYVPPAQLLFLFLKHLYRNESTAYKLVCNDIPSACKQHKAAKFLCEIKELGYMGKGVHWRQSSCSRIFWTFIYHLPLHNHGVIAVISYSHQRLHFFLNSNQISGIRPLAYAHAGWLQLSMIRIYTG